MAEAAVVSALIGTFTTMVADKLSEEVSLILNFRKDFEFFCEELLYIKCLLTDAGEKRNSSLVSNWLDSIEDFVADAEYLMEQCGPVDKFFAKLKFRLKMGYKIRELKERLKQIRGKAKDLKLLKAVLDVNAHGQARDADGFNEKERSYALPQEPQIVGMDDEIKVITKWILKEDSPPVIAVVGMGGQGKTLLLQRVFNSEEIRQRFDHHVWLAISQKYNDEKLLGQVLRELEPNHNSVNLTKGELIEKIHKKLEKKRCLFAVDDVWDRYAWEKIGLPFRIEDKVVLTTREEKIAKALGAGDHIHPKNSLSEENSWQLFCLHAFPDGAHHCPEALDKIAREIVKKCGGLPLAIKTIGAHLARLVRRLPNDWQWTLDRLNEVDGMRDRVVPSLKLSYQALPPHLKPCFLYCSVFPKNTKIQSEYLVYAWIAQGFVSAEGLQDSYSVGRSYMEDLIDRCLIEVSEVLGHGRVWSCKMHDLLHDLAVSEQTKCLLKPGGQLERIPAEECQGLRRISLMKNEISTIQNGIRCPGLRSLLLSHNYSLESISSSFFDNMRYLCVLDLSWTPITSLPDSIGNLRLLKYLNLSWTKIEELPESLSGLRHLQSLDVSCTNIRLHSGIDKHKYMLHLNLGTGIYSCPVGISKLIYLQTLEGVTVTDGNAASANALQLRDLKGLTLLQHLSLSIEYGDYQLEDEGTFRGMTKMQLEDEGTFRGMTKMRTLYVGYHGSRGSFHRSLHLPTDMEAMERLEIVSLSHCVVPKGFFQLQNLMELTLSGPAYSSSADFRGLEKIPNLKMLCLRLNRNPDFIEFPNEFGEAGAFPKLEELVIRYFRYLKSIPSFHEDAMPRLRCLRMEGCELRENMPEGLTKLKNLKEVEVEMRVDSLENFKYRKRHCWQSLKDRQIEIKVKYLRAATD